MPGRAKSIRFRLPPVLWALAAIIVLALVGCGSSDKDPSGSDHQGAESSASLVDWPYFGRVPERTHYLPEPPRRSIDPPLREAWSINTHALIEFPPALANGVAYVVNKFGNAKAVRLSDRKVLWERRPDPSDEGKPTDVTAPVYDQGVVYFAHVGGDLEAVDAETGRVKWHQNLQSHLESSPIVVKGRLYIGDDETNLIALRASDGKLLWQFNSPGAIKASPSYHDGRVYVGDYQGSMYGLEADSGKVVWRTNTTKAPPFGSGGFFSSPAIGFGRVYAARDDGTLFAFDLDNGKVGWSFPTGESVYGSPAIARVPGTPPSVYIGSENGRFYALDARDGKVRWRYEVGGAIPGTATVIGHTVYTSSFATRETVGIDARNGIKSFGLKQAGYTPMVSDGRRLFLIGYYELVGLEPKRP